MCLFCQNEWLQLNCFYQRSLVQGYTMSIMNETRTVSYDVSPAWLANSAREASRKSVRPALRQLKGKKFTKLDLSNLELDKCVSIWWCFCAPEKARSMICSSLLEGENQLGDNAAAAIASLIHALPLRSLILAGNVLGTSAGQARNMQNSSKL